MERPQRFPAPRRSQVGRICLCERTRGGLQRGFEEPRGVPHRRIPPARTEHADHKDLPLEHRLLARMSGLLAHERHRARRVPLVAAARRRAGLPHQIDARRGMPGRNIRPGGRSDQPNRRRCRSDAELRAARRRGPAGRGRAARRNDRSRRMPRRSRPASPASRPGARSAPISTPC